jgi:hypothetical protein
VSCFLCTCEVASPRELLWVCLEQEFLTPVLLLCRATLDVEVAGGLCDKTLGTSTLRVKLSGCSYYTASLTQQFFKGQHFVPAHIIDIEVTKVKDENGKPLDNVEKDLTKAIRTQTIDLRKDSNTQEGKKKVASSAIVSSGTSQSEDADTTEKPIPKVRFQYDGDLLMDFKWTGIDNHGDCTLPPDETNNEDSDVTTSFHVTPTGSSFIPVVYLRYELLDDVYCSVVDESFSVRVENKVGTDQGKFRTILYKWPSR